MRSLSLQSCIPTPDLVSLAKAAEHIARQVEEFFQKEYSLTIGLSGNLGAGKTTFMTYFVKALGIQDAVSSPTFVLEQQYQRKDLLISHWDLYRLGAPPEEIYEPPHKGEIRCIEWIEKVPSFETYIDLLLRFEIINDSRTLSVHTHAPISRS